MKKLILLYALMLTFGSVKSQNLQILGSDKLKVVLEAEYHSENSFGFAYTEAMLINPHSKYLYVQLFWEQKWWQAPVFLHGEFRTTIGNDYKMTNLYYAGIAWNVLSKERGYITLEPLYRYDNGHQWQFTFVSGAQYKRLLFTNYIDVYGAKRPALYSESRIFYRVVGGVYLGLYVDVSSDYGMKHWQVNPMAALRIDIKKWDYGTNKKNNNQSRKSRKAKR